LPAREERCRDDRQPPAGGFFSPSDDALAGAGKAIPLRALFSIRQRRAQQTGHQQPTGNDCLLLIR
jgi:hypothetical protein